MEIEIESYSVIYSMELFEEELEYHKPDNPELWVNTEDHESEEIDNAQHYKYIAILNPEQFEEFIQNTRLYAEDVETMGSIGAPGYGIHWAPAISFVSTRDAFLSAYVTPNPKNPEDGQHWDKIQEQIITKYGY